MGMSQPSPAAVFVCPWAGSERGSWRNKARVPGKAGARRSCVFTAGKVSGLRGFLVPIKCANHLPRPCHVLAATSPFSPWEYSLPFSAMFSLKFLRQQPLVFLQPQESTCPVLWGEEGTCPSSSPASFLGKWIYGGVFQQETTSLPHHFCARTVVLGLLATLGTADFCKTLTQAHPNHVRPCLQMTPVTSGWRRRQGDPWGQR